jgi:signal transduction histidine kinase
MTDEILHKLQERVKELTALHKTARILQDEARTPSEVIQQIVALLPPAWQYPEVTVARISYKSLSAATPGFRPTEWTQRAEFRTRDHESGVIEIVYLEKCPESDEGPFMQEERDLIESLAEMLRSYFQHRLADEAIKTAHDNLEQLVSERTEELKQTNAALQAQINEFKEAEKKIEIYQGQLRQLAAELSQTEARERRVIAEDLHDHIGQGLAFIKMSISQFQGDAMFCGFEGKIGEIMTLLDQTIVYTRNLTFEISPPILYELGLESALEWLAGRIQKKHGTAVSVKKLGQPTPLSDEIKVAMFKSAQELLTNAVKHARAMKIGITITESPELLSIEVADDGCGFDAAILTNGAAQHDRFGLFNIRERMHYLGGSMHVQSTPGTGTRITLAVPRQSKGSTNENTYSPRR